jgi:hypothetical protein
MDKSTENDRSEISCAVVRCGIKDGDLACKIAWTRRADKDMKGLETQ